MIPLKIITDNIQQIYPYNKKTNASQNIEKKNNKTEENKIPLTGRQTSIHFFIDDSLSKLRELIKTPKPYIVSRPIRKEMKYMKIVKNEALKNFHMSSIKASSAKVTKNNFYKNEIKSDPFSAVIKNKLKNKNRKLKLDLDNIFSKDKKINNTNKSQQNYNNKINISKKFTSNISNIKTNYSSLPTEGHSKGNFDIKYIYNYNDKKNNKYDESDVLGYKNYFSKNPSYTENGVIKSFIDNVNNLRKDYYKNYCLKLNEFKTNILYENKLSQIQLNKRNNEITNYYLNQYYDGFNIYWYRLNKEIKKESENIERLEYTIKEIKMQINKLSNRIQKRLIKIIDIVIMRKFFEEMKKFSSFELGTPSYKLLEIKEEIIKKVKNYEMQTNYIRYILNDKDLGIYSFIENNKDIFYNKDLKNIIISQINEMKEIPTILNLNIKNLLMEKHYIEKEQESLNNILSDLIKESKENNYYERKLQIEYKYCIKKLSQIKTNNEYLDYKLEKLKAQSPNDNYGSLNKNIRNKILQIIKTLNKGKYITEKENTHLHEIFLKSKTKYFVECMFIIEKKINLLNEFKEEVINKNEEFLEIYTDTCNIEEAKRRRTKDLRERAIKRKNLIDKINKKRYPQENKKDFYYINRTIYLKNKEKIEKEKMKEKNKEKNDIYPAFKSIMKII